MRHRLCALLFAASLLSACGGGSSSIVTQTPKSGQTTLTIHASIPVAGALTTARKRALFVSPLTQGIAVTVTPHGAATPVVYQGAFDISPASSLCTTGASARTCTLMPAVPAGGPYDVVFSTYDAVPVGGSFTSAKQLGAGTTPSVSIAAGQANSIGVSVGGVVASAFVTPPVTAFHALKSLTQTVAAGALDADGNLIITSGAETYVDANGAAVSIALGATGSEANTFAFSPASITNSITPVSLTYSAADATSGQQTSGFSVTLTATPSNIPTTVAQTLVTIAAATASLPPEYNTGLSGYAHGIASGPDGNIWYVSDALGVAGAISTQGAIVHSIPSVGNGFDIVAGPDGDLWFTNETYNAITSISPTTLQVTNYAIPTAGADPHGIAVGSDGNIWFTENAAGKIGKLALSPTITFSEYTLSSPSDVPLEICNGPDGALWFTEQGADKIGRIDPSTAHITEFAVPDGAGLDGIVAGPDGKLWFVAEDANFIEGMSTTGSFTPQYVITPTDSTPTGIIAGPDGRLWFGSAATSEIGAITTSGALSFYATHTGSSEPIRLTVGSDGNIWYAEYANGKIGVAVL